MDGVLADFDGAMRSRLGISWVDGMMSSDEKWEKIDRYNDTAFPWFVTLPIMRDAMKLWNFLTSEFEHVEILSASGNTILDAAAQKRSWIRDHIGLGVVVNVVTKSRDKAKFATPNTVLIDDRMKSIKPFVAAGGIGIQHVNTEQTLRALHRLM